MNQNLTMTIPPTAAALLFQLGELGVTVTTRGEHLSFRPASLIPPELWGQLREQKSEMIELIDDPRQRWRSQSLSLIQQHQRPVKIWLEWYDERVAIATIDGGLDEDQAGRLAWERLKRIFET